MFISWEIRKNPTIDQLTEPAARRAPKHRLQRRAEPGRRKAVVHWAEPPERHQGLHKSNPDGVRRETPTAVASRANGRKGLETEIFLFEKLHCRAGFAATE